MDTRDMMGRKMGSPELRNTIASELRLNRRINRLARIIASVACNRIAFPRRGNKVAHFATVEGKGCVKYANEKASIRRAVELSFHDRQEVGSIVRSLLIRFPEMEVKDDGKKRLPRATWKELFREAREALQMYRKGIDAPITQEALETWLAPYLEAPEGNASDAHARAAYIDEEKAEAREKAKIDRIYAKLAHHRRALMLAWGADTSRKRNATLRAMLAFAEACANASLGNGHGSISRDQVHAMRRRYLAYLAQGEALLVARESAREEADALAASMGGVSA